MAKSSQSKKATNKKMVKSGILVSLGIVVVAAISIAIGMIVYDARNSASAGGWTRIDVKNGVTMSGCRIGSGASIGVKIIYIKSTRTPNHRYSVTVKYKDSRGRILSGTSTGTQYWNGTVSLLSPYAKVNRGGSVQAKVGNNASYARSYDQVKRWAHC